MGFGEKRDILTLERSVVPKSLGDSSPRERPRYIGDGCGHSLRPWYYRNLPGLAVANGAPAKWVCNSVFQIPGKRVRQVLPSRQPMRARWLPRCCRQQPQKF